MYSRRSVFIAGVLFLLTVGLSRQISHAQPGDTGTCSSFVQTAIEALGTNCDGLGRNSACYGTYRVNATFTDPAVEPSFSIPADQVLINALQSIRTFPLNAAANEWGVAVINAQANIPGALPGQNAVFLLIGDAEMESAVDPENTFVPGDPLAVETLAATRLYQQPGADAEVVTEIPAGAALLTDALSEDGLWLRTAYDDLAGWVALEDVTADDDLIGLPVYTPRSYTPMQAFYFRTSFNTECSQAPDAVVIQGPEDLSIDINANGADIRLGSTILMQTLPVDEAEQQRLRELYGLTSNVGSLFLLIVLDGEAIINPDSDNPIHVPAGYSTVACLTTPENLGTDGLVNDSVILADCGFAPPTPLTPEEWNQFALLHNLTLNYPIDLSDYLEGDTCQPRADWVNTYVVRQGDTLSRIAAWYEVSTGTMASANCIQNPNLVFSGARLRVPNASQPPLPATPTMTPTAVPPTDVPPADVPATAVPPTGVPPTPVPPTQIVTPEVTPDFTPEVTPNFTPEVTEAFDPQADLGLSIYAAPNPVNAEGIVTYDITLVNYSYGTLDATNVQVSNLLPDQFWYSESPSPAVGTYDSSTDIWTLPFLASGDSATIAVNAEVPYYESGDISHTVSITASDQPDYDPSDNSASITVTVQGAA